MDILWPQRLAGALWGEAHAGRDPVNGDDVAELRDPHAVYEQRWRPPSSDSLSEPCEPPAAAGRLPVGRPRQKVGGSPLLGVTADLLAACFRFLPPESLARAAQVCRAFVHTIDDRYEMLWGGVVAKLRSFRVPSPRTCHAGVCYGNRFVCIGGMPESRTIRNVKQALCTLDMRRWVWTTQEGDDIPAVTEHTAVLWKDKMIVFGGYYEDQGRRNHVYVVDKLGHSPTTRVPDCRGDAPPPRSSHSAVCYENHMYVFGGWERVVPKDDLYKLDLRSWTWSCVHSADRGKPSAVGAAPSARRAHVSFVHGGCMYVFGGVVRDGRTDVECRTDVIHCFDIGTETWRVEEVHGDIPCPRSRCRGEIHDGVFYLIGGWDSDRYFGDVHGLDMDTLTWRRLPASLPCGVVQHATCVHSGKLLTWGGFHSHETRKRTRGMQEAEDGAATNGIHMLQLRAAKPHVQRSLKARSRGVRAEALANDPMCIAG